MNLTYKYKSPFNFLSPFEKDDELIFFGRDDEIAEVFNQFKKTNLVVIYGPSGSGKSSVALCGLTNRFFEWESFIIRRDENFINSFFNKIEGKISSDQKLKIEFYNYYSSIRKIEQIKNELKSLSRKKINSSENSSNLPETKEKFESLKMDLSKSQAERGESLARLNEIIEEINEELAFAPFLIFDQFEEIFISGTREERKEFSVLLSILTQETKLTNIVICIQTDFLGDLFEFETYNPGILHHKVLVEDPNDENVREILSGNFKHFNVNQRLSNSDKRDRIQDIIDLQKKEGKIYLPFLQIFINKLYIDDFIRDYPDQSELLENPESIDYSTKALTFEESEIKSYGGIEQILANYIKDINDELNKKSNDITTTKTKDVVIKFLKNFANEDNTRKIIKYEVVKKNNNIEYFRIDDETIRLRVTRDIWNDGNSEHDESIGDIINELISARILRRRDNNYLEISHNKLVKVINQYTDDREVNEYYKMSFNSAYQAFEQQSAGQSTNQITSVFDVLKKNLFGRKEVNRAYYFPEQLMNAVGDFNHIIDDTDPKRTKKKDFWNQSKYYARVSKNLNTAGLIIAIILIISFGFYSYVSKQKSNAYEEEKLKALEDVRELRDNDEMKLMLRSLVSIALDIKKTDITGSYNMIVGIIEIVEKNDFLNKEDFPLCFDTYREMRNNYIANPFYLKKIQLPSKDWFIKSTKSRVLLHSKDKILLFGKSPSNLYSKEINIDNSVENREWHSLFPLNEQHSTSHKYVTSFEPYITKSEARVLYSTDQGLVDNSFQFNDKKLEETNDMKLRKLSAIEYIRGNLFICIDSKKKSLLRLRIKSEQFNDIKYVPIVSENNTNGITNIKNFINENDSIAKKLTKNPRLSNLTKISDTEICYLATFYSTNSKSTYIIRQEIYKEAAITGFKNLDGLFKVDQEDYLRDIKFDKHNGRLLLASTRFIYSINLEDLTHQSEMPNPLLISHHDARLNSIDIGAYDISNEKDNIKESMIILGSDDKKASIYIDKDPQIQGDEVLVSELVGHSQAISNTTLYSVGDKIIVLTFGEDNMAILWDVSSLYSGNYYIKGAREPIQLKYQNDKLFAGYHFMNNIYQGKILEFDKDLIAKPKSKELKKGPRRSLTSFDFQNNEVIYTGTYGLGTIGVIGNNRNSLNPEKGKSKYINDVRIRGNNLAVATSSGLFVLENYKDEKSKFKKFTSEIDSRLIDLEYNSVDIHPTKPNVLLATTDLGIYLWNIKESNYQHYDKHKDDVTDGCFSEDGKYFVTGSWDNTAILWKYIGDEKLNDLSYGKRKDYKYYFKMNSHSSDIEDVDIYQSNIIATASSDKTVNLYKINEGDYEINDQKILEHIFCPIRHEYSIRAVTFGENENTLYSADRMGNIRKWDLTEIKNKIDNNLLSKDNKQTNSIGF